MRFSRFTERFRCRIVGAVQASDIHLRDTEFAYPAAQRCRIGFFGRAETTVTTAIETWT
jgi:hypothetical protein